MKLIKLFQIKKENKTNEYQFTVLILLKIRDVKPMSKDWQVCFHKVFRLF